MEKKYYIPKNKALQHLSPKFVIRVGSSDIKSVDETWVKKQYQRPSAGFIIRPGERWLDLGANIGAFSVYAALQGAQVRAYEAQRHNITMVRANIQANNLKEKIEVFRLAVVPDSSHGRKLKFYESTNPVTFRRHTLYGNYLNS
ncbi:MAG TPA: FkbM family methyltransferase, partial [Candidatus Kapabacteria bacterium]|nr:FkbM family methyltransferase [Candidatus Kapabacteria bacterium]